MSSSSTNEITANDADRARPGRNSGSGTRRRFLTKVTFIATLGGLLFGYDTGVISGALLYMKDDLHLTPLGQATVVSSLLFGAMFGALLGGTLADKIGRKGSLLVCAVLFTTGALGAALAPSVELMVTARIVLGVAVGAAATTCPLYLAELAPAHRRGRIVTVNELMIVTGVLLAYVINALIASLGGADVWRWMLGVAVVPAVALLVGMLLLPDTPRWYALHGRYEDARRVLKLSHAPAEASHEFDSIVEHAKRDIAEKKKGAALRDLRSFPWMRRILWVGIGLAIAQQATGINTAIYYAPTILESTGLGANASLIATIAVGVIGVIGVAVGIVLLGFMNRRPLLLTGFAGVAGSHLALALCFQLPQSTGRSYVILAAMVLFVAFVQCFIGVGSWLLLSEIFPMAIRGFAMGITVCVLWGINTAISFVFPIFIGAAGPTWTFGLFVVVNLGSVFFVHKRIPETRGRTLEELEDDFRSRAGHTDLRHGAPANVHGS